MSICLPNIFGIKRRKYPIKCDEYGRSARQRAFLAFDNGKSPSDINQSIDISIRTAHRYYADWKKLPRNLNSRYRSFKWLMKNSTEFSNKTIDMMADYLGMTKNEVIMKLQEPWALKQFLKGDLPNRKLLKQQTHQERRLGAALRMVRFMEEFGIRPEEMAERFQSVITEVAKDAGNQTNKKSIDQRTNDGETV